eukprot:gene4902-biopygen12862
MSRFVCKELRSSTISFWEAQLLTAAMKRENVDGRGSSWDDPSNSIRAARHCPVLWSMERSDSKFSRSVATPNSPSPFCLWAHRCNCSNDASK